MQINQNGWLKLMEHKEIQKIAKGTIEYIKTVIQPGMNLLDVRKICEEKMLSLGADSFWYYDIGAFVFSGEETILSVSGRKYKTSDRIIQSNDIITIDLSPQRNKIWGDYARTVIIENGSVVQNIEDIRNDEWRNGLLMEEKLHEKLKEFATPSTTFEELFYYMNSFISDNGYVNLDFLGNLGHSIVKSKIKRVYIEKGNRAKLGDVEFFTFEPHIRKVGGSFGYKKENIYYFNNGILTEL